MTADADAFLDAIFAAPADDTPRLVYADWLEEHGQPAYAEFIRLSCGFNRDGKTRAERKEIGPHWIAAFRKFVADNHESLGPLHLAPRMFDRGIIGDLWIDAPTLLKTYAAWGPLLGPRGLVVSDYGGMESELMSAPFVQRVTFLRFTPTFHPVDTTEREYEPWPDGCGLLRVLARSTADRLCELEILGVRPTEAVLREFACSPLVNQLTHFRLVVIFDDYTGEDLVYPDGPDDTPTLTERLATFLREHSHRFGHGPWSG
jgi:uncharacterized protein (TIGR02996 family)